ncbi:MAG: AbrB/MazE/SpoVT family DNA-binding domain-containing protein [Candidatus Freyarchaeota archaeon]|nr:AbrB/MazE/SpoVT family DNA-binding domain-containing protein [Candidatus Jordarchaeia archaeon]MBS7268530.1 AbrB/MazE/SpoVT family DNA-binding domain-containing protein [Candidatus Jordarchaeia archaeon]MBS7279009.1 AbrB/MazE/SpoVT family DNA-binding domain-containing protein [Candidatus Jordarchaeia archaeon]
MVESSIVHRIFTLAIPKRVREELKNKGGMEILWRVEDNKIVLEPKSFRNLHGRFKGTAKYATEKDKQEVETVFLSEGQKNEPKTH